MQLTAPAILLAARAHGETAVIARMLTEQHGMVAAYVAGGRGRQLRPVVIPGNVVQAEIRAKSDSQLPFARLVREITLHDEGGGRLRIDFHVNSALYKMVRNMVGLLLLVGDRRARRAVRPPG